MTVRLLHLKPLFYFILKLLPVLHPGANLICKKTGCPKASCYLNL